MGDEFEQDEFVDLDEMGDEGDTFIVCDCPDGESCWVCE